MPAASPAKQPPSSSSSSSSSDNASKDATSPAALVVVPLSELIAENVVLMVQGVQLKESSKQFTVLARLQSIRERLDYATLKGVCEKWNPDPLAFLPEEKMDVSANAEDPSKAMDVDQDEGAEGEGGKKKKKAPKQLSATAKMLKELTAPECLELGALPEVQMFLHLLVTLYLVDQKSNVAAAASSEAQTNFVSKLNRRSMDLLSGRIFYYYALTHERINQLTQITPRCFILHRTACIQHNEVAKATLTNTLLRSLLSQKLYDHADNFRVQNVEFPETASNGQYARYLFYLGQIDSIRLRYSKALEELNQALRKAPQSRGLGFRQKIQKMLIIVQLLIGDLPKRSVFNQKGLEHSLTPYLELTRAVRVGDLGYFKEVLAKFGSRFEADGVYSLIIRLHHNVVKTGLRKINVAYTRIGLDDVSAKLNLESAENAAYIITKGVKDGVVEGHLDSERDAFVSNEVPDVYLTDEPAREFNKRIQFCMNIHNEAVKSMRFPKDAHKSKRELDEEEARRMAEMEDEFELDPEDAIDD
jgi:26S proteasome regulatory subunit N3